MRILFLMVLVSCAPQVEESMTQGPPTIDQRVESILASNGGKDLFILPESDDFENIPQDPNNPLNKSKVELGKNLYHETAIAISPKNEALKYTYSCASCHFAEAGFTSGNAQGIGEGGIGDGIDRVANPLLANNLIDIQPIKSPTILNTAYFVNNLWNGQFGAGGHNEGLDHLFTEGTPKEVNNLGFEGVETQAIAGLGVHGLISNDDVLVDSWISNNEEYIELFKKSFSKTEEKEITKVSIGLAIAAFERTVLANKAPFQRYLKGDKSALSEEEKKGLLLFFGKAQCIQCHNGPNLSDGNFYAIGLSDLDENREAIITDPNNTAKNGRESFTGDSKDLFKFKTPQLYNLKDQATFGHGSSFTSIDQVIRYKNKIRFPQNRNLTFSDLSFFDRELGLNEEEISQLRLFLVKSLYDPNLDRYVPDSTISQLPFPNNDSAISLD